MNAICPINRDKLIVALLIDDLVEELNQAMKVRRITLRMDYLTNHPVLVASMPGALPQIWMLTDTRKKLCIYQTMANPHLQLFAQDVKDRLAKLGGSLFLVGYKPAHGPKKAKLQICVEGSDKIAVTLRTLPRGYVSAPLTEFIPPVPKA